MYVLLDDFKHQINLDDDWHDDDAYCITLLEAAEDAVSQHLNKPLKECLVKGELQPSVRHAIMLLASSWYANREAVSYGSPKTTPMAFEYLISLNKRYSCP